MSRSIYNDAGRAGMSDTKTATKRFAITLDRVLVGLLLVEGLLFLSDQYDWFAFNQRKGWTVLIAVVVVGGVLLLMSLWAAISWMVSRWIKIRPFQFGLRSGLLLVAVVGSACGWLGAALRQARQQAEICEEIRNVGGGVCHREFDDMVKVPEWLKKAIGIDFFADVEKASAVNDEGILQIARLSQLEDLFLDSSVVFDESMTHMLPTGINSAFSTTGLSQIQTFTELKRFHLSVGDLSARDLLAVHLPETLEELTLAGDNLDDLILERIGKLPELRALQLDLADPRWPSLHPPNRRTIDVTDGGLRHLAGLAKLRELKLINTDLTDEALVHLQGLRELRELSLQAARIEGTGLAHLQALPNLESLDISYNRIEEENLRYLRTIPSLKRLDLTDVHDAGLTHISQIQQLESLRAWGMKATATGVSQLKQLRSLKTVDLGPVWQNRELTKGVSELDQIVHLELYGDDMTDDMWSDLHPLKQLKTLQTGLTNMASPAIQALKKALPNCDVRPF